MIDYSLFLEKLSSSPLKSWHYDLSTQISAALNTSRHGDLAKWQELLQQFPEIKPSSINLQSDCISIGTSADCSSETQTKLKSLLRGFHPWRKGPYNLFGIHIDTEWRSDFKWNRLNQHIQPLQDRLVLDIGCGNGYHCWRMAGAGAKFVIGIDPMLLFVMQYQTIQHFINSDNTFVLPLGIEDLPTAVNAFDTVFSMGILYHRRSPLEHLKKLSKYLRDGGELVLESLVIDGGKGESLKPQGRYAKMKNIWVIPSCATIEHWLCQCGFKNIRLVDVSVTTTEEQRRTDWMTFESLSDFLDPNDPMRTIEGFPAPKRAVFISENH